LHGENPSQPIPVHLIREPSHRLREKIDPQRIGELADSIAAEGLHQPVGIRGPFEDASYEIVFGHRRLLAHQLLRRETIEAKIYPPDYDPLQAAVTENLNREQMTPMEEAQAVARFVERGEPDAAIARLFRRSAGWVRMRRQVLTWPADVQEAIQRGDFPLAVAEQIADIDHETYRQSLVAEARRTGATAATAAIWRQHYLADRDRIIGNNLIIEEIAQRREAWKIVVPCDLCELDQDYENTRSVRVCVECRNQLTQVKAEARAEKLAEQFKGTDTAHNPLQSSR
jgi:ParB/RepB/Spo0J family partition protein